MILAFSGDPFLARRAFLRAVAERSGGGDGAEVVRLGAGADERALRDACAQGGLFGATAVGLDLDEAVPAGGQAASAAKTRLIDALAETLAASSGVDVLVLDPSAPPGRQKRYRDHGELRHLPTPRFAALQRWVQDELRAAGVVTRGDVAGVLADLFGDDLPGIAGEIEKLAALGEPLEAERVRTLANRPAARTAFDLIEATASGDSGAALGIARSLIEAGEPPARVFATLGWQLDLVARVWALMEARSGLGADAAAKELGASPYPTKRAMAVARRLGEPTLLRVCDLFVACDARAKSGGDPEWQLEACVLGLADALRPA